MLDVHMPESVRTTTLELPHIGSSPHNQSEAFAAIEQIGERTIRDIVRPGMTVAIAFTDDTRTCPDHILIAWLLSELHAAGINTSDITLLCAKGLHRPMTDEELRKKLGSEIAEAVTVLNHDATDSDTLVTAGVIDDIPVVFNRRCSESDVVMATGVVEPHQYAGYSGGAKTIVIGCGGEATIQGTHGPGMLDKPGTVLGRIEGNPFQEFVRQAGALAGLDYVVNVVQDDAGNIVKAAAGPPNAVHDHLVGFGRTYYEVPVEYPVHMAIAGLNAAKAVNLYQASRGITYLALADRTPLLPGAPIILRTDIPEGAGEGIGEQRFFELLRDADSPQHLIERLRVTGFPAGAQRAYILAKALVQHPVIVVGEGDRDIIEACHMRSVTDMESAVSLAEQLAREHFALSPAEKPEVLVIPNALLMMPKLRTARL